MSIYHLIFILNFIFKILTYKIIYFNRTESFKILLMFEDKTNNRRITILRNADGVRFEDFNFNT